VIADYELTQTRGREPQRNTHTNARYTHTLARTLQNVAGQTVRTIRARIHSLTHTRTRTHKNRTEVINDRPVDRMSVSQSKTSSALRSEFETLTCDKRENEKCVEKKKLENSLW